LNRYELIPAISADRDWLEQLRRSVYQELFRATWGAWDEARHVRQFEEFIAEGHVWIIHVDGVRVGIVQLFREPESVDIGEIQIDPSHQNHGIATNVLSDVITNAHRDGMAVRLSVALKNDGALRLYERLGFCHVIRTATHYHLENSRDSTRDSQR
jgi:ribosomal protein S18 acetylase RimI-like enzyme